MKTLLYTISLLTIFSLCFGLAQEKGGGMGDMMKKWKDSMTPDEHHKKLDGFVGKWDVTMSVQMSPDAPPQITKGTAEYKWVLGGRYLMQESFAKFMGMSSNGIGYNGYDKIRKQYFCVWMDEMGTGVIYGTGDYDSTGKVLTLNVKVDDPMTGEMGKEQKYVFTWLDDNTFKFVTLEGGKSTMEITYERKK